MSDPRRLAPRPAKRRLLALAFLALGGCALIDAGGGGNLCNDANDVLADCLGTTYEEVADEDCTPDLETLAECIIDNGEAVCQALLDGTSGPCG